MLRHRPFSSVHALTALGVALAAVGCQPAEEAGEASFSQNQALLRGETGGSGESGSSDPQLGSLRALQRASATPASVRLANGFPRSVGGSIPVDGVDAVDRAEVYLQTYRDLYRQASPDLFLGVRRTLSDRLMDHVTFYQTYKGLPVYGGELLVSLQGGRVVATAGSLLTQDTVLETLTPALTAADAELLARQASDKLEAPVIGDTRLVVFDSSLFGQGRPDPRLAYKVVLGARSGQILIDALTGKILVAAAAEQTGALDEYDLDLEDANGTNAKATDCFTDTTLDDQAGDEDEVYDDWASDTQVNALWSISKNTYLFYFNTFGRESYDDDGEQIELYAHSSTKGGASYSAGCDLFQFTDPFVGFDVMVHEFTHAVIGQTSSLDYVGESGALNEGYADIMASLADGNWTMGESTPNGTIRDLQTPTNFSQPDRYSNLFVPAMPWDDDNSDDNDDNGGVHTNSGIWNKGASLLADGGSFNGQNVTGIGKTKMGELYYIVMQVLPASSSMFTARDYTVSAAQLFVQMGWAGFTANNVCQVRNALAAVELGAPDTDCDGNENPTDTDDDNDFVPDAIDNCPTVANPGQQESWNDPDLIGDACDPDDDNDGALDGVDNCGKYNPDQKDKNNNGLGDACEDYDLDGIYDDDDNCMVDANPDQKDSDNDGEGDVCDLDLDGDGITGFSDNCQFVENADQKDTDGDGLGDACDPCPEDANEVNAWTTGIPELGIPPKPLLADTDGDGIPDSCDGSKFGDSSIAVDGTLNYDVLDPDGKEHRIDVGGVAGSSFPIDLNFCPRCVEYGSDYRVSLDLVGLSRGVLVRVADDTGRAVARSAEGEEKSDLSFIPEGGRSYRLYFHLGADYSREPVSFSAVLSAGGSSSSGESGGSGGEETPPPRER